MLIVKARVHKQRNETENAELGQYIILFKVSESTIAELTRKRATVHVQIDLFGAEHVQAGRRTVLLMSRSCTRLHRSAGKEQALHEPAP